MIQAFEDLGKLNNTLIIYINGDNGTSAEGGPLGTPNEVAFFNGVNMMPVAEQMKWYDVWGTEQTYNHMSAGWSWAFDTPFDWFKQNASRLGGINQNMVVSWPAHQGQGGVARTVHSRHRRGSHHPRGHRHPRARDGRWHQTGADRGHELRVHLDAENAKAASRHTTQYFEMMGQWALYKDGWVLSTKVNRAPWEAFGPANPDPLNNQVFQLYDLNADFTQSNDIAANNPQKVEEMRQAFLAEARKYQVFPLDASVAARIVAPRPNITAGRSEFVYTRPMVDLPQGNSPLLLNTSYTVIAEIEVPQGGAEGMILDLGRAIRWLRLLPAQGKAGMALEHDRPGAHQVGGPEALTPGKHTVEFDFKYDGTGRAHWPLTTSPAWASLAPARLRSTVM